MRANKILSNESISKIWGNVNNKPMKVNLLASGWSDSYPHEQTVNVEGVTVDNDVKVIGVFHANGNTAEADKDIDKAAALLMYYDDGVGNGTITFRAKKKPAVDFTAIIELG